MQTMATDSGPWAHRFLGIMRIMVGLVIVEYGLAKIFGWPYATQFDGVHAFQLVWFSGLIEWVGGTLFTLGLFTRCVAFVMSGEMAFAYFLRHAPRSFFPVVNGGALAIVLCFLFFYVFLVGSGAYSIDNARR
jgi:putative oxidoreductase